jgi:hypothetical protein
MTKRVIALSKVYQLIEPSPVVLVSTWNGSKSNIMTMSWHMTIDFETKSTLALLTSKATAKVAHRFRHLCNARSPKNIWEGEAPAEPTVQRFGRARLLPSQRCKGSAGASPSRAMNDLGKLVGNMFTAVASPSPVTNRCCVPRCEPGNEWKKINSNSVRT